MCFSELLGYFVADGDSSPVVASGSQPAGRELWMVFPWYEMTFEGLWRSRSGIFFEKKLSN